MVASHSRPRLILLLVESLQGLHWTRDYVSQINRLIKLTTHLMCNSRFGMLESLPSNARPVLRIRHRYRTLLPSWTLAGLNDHLRLLFPTTTSAGLLSTVSSERG
jgi:hypothetical protein